MNEFRIKTRTRTEFVNIAGQVAEALRSDPDVVRDMGMALGRIVPGQWDYAHAEGNSDSHIQCSLVGPSQTIIVHNGKLVLGQWQGIFFCEFDGPRERRIFVKIVSDGLE
jgi:secondary thiamine-phosphate synthase enzyme